MYVIESLVDRKATAWAEFVRVPSVEEAEAVVGALWDENVLTVRRRKVDA